jgi:TonB family protein
VLTVENCKKNLQEIRSDPFTIPEAKLSTSNRRTPMKRFSILPSAAAIFFFCGFIPAQETKGKTSKPAAVDVMEAMRYPSAARTARVQGEVVVQIKLDDAGYVVGADALPDPDDKKAMLTREAIANAQKWRFRPNRGHETTIVYDFVLVGECSPDDSDWRFVFTTPNAVSISDCATLIQLPAERQKAGATAGDLTLLSFEEMKYPPLANTARIQGEVMLHADLDDDGKVVSVSVVAGHPMLVEAAISNIKKWRFKPNPEKQVTMVYSFRLGERLCPASDFSFEPPNRVIIKGCAYQVNP